MHTKDLSFYLFVFVHTKNLVWRIEVFSSDCKIGLVHTANSMLYLAKWVHTVTEAGRFDDGLCVPSSACQFILFLRTASQHPLVYFLTKPQVFLDRLLPQNLPPSCCACTLPSLIDLPCTYLGSDWGTLSEFPTTFESVSKSPFVSAVTFAQLLLSILSQPLPPGRAQAF